MVITVGPCTQTGCGVSYPHPLYWHAQQAEDPHAACRAALATAERERDDCRGADHQPFTHTHEPCQGCWQTVWLGDRREDERQAAEARADTAERERDFFTFSMKSWADVAQRNAVDRLNAERDRNAAEARAERLAAALRHVRTWEGLVITAYLTAEIDAALAADAAGEGTNAK